MQNTYGKLEIDIDHKKIFFLSDFDKSSKNNMKNAYAKLENEIHIDRKKYSFLSDFDKS